VPSCHRIVCRLQYALYGLKQSPRAWFSRFSLAMDKYGFPQRSFDHILFLKHKKFNVIVLIIYDVDMIITGDDRYEISKIQRQFETQFKIKNLRSQKYFLEMLHCKRVDTSTIQNQKLGRNSDSIPSNNEQYHKLVVKLIYMSHTRFDIAYAASIVSQFIQNLSEVHIDVVIRILHYLKCAPGKRLMFCKNNHLNVEWYTDADSAVACLIENPHLGTSPWG